MMRSRPSALAIAMLCVTVWMVWIPPAYGQNARLTAASAAVAPQSLAAALKTFSLRTRIQIIYTAKLAAGLRSPGAPAGLSAKDAIQSLLSGTGLKALWLNDHTVSIVSRESAVQRSGSDGSKPSDTARPHADASGAHDIPDSNGEIVRADSPDAKQKTTSLEEIVVTGTHIRGTTDAAAPLYVFSHQDIERTGAGTVQDFLTKLTMDFKGGAGEDTFSTGAGQTENLVGGSGVNLRGLGNDATLVLIDGHRVAPGGTTGSFVDLSMIPLSAVERIEIEPDGASAIYGSDAVGGVVNIILRRQFNGAETSLRYSTVASGNNHQQQVGQTVGHDWQSGSAVLTYEYLGQTALSAADRSYTNGALLPFDLIPDQVYHGAYVALTQRINDVVDVFADGMFSHRNTYQDIYAAVTDHFRYTAQISAYSGVLGANVALPREIEFSVSSNFGDSQTSGNEYQGAPLSLSAIRKALSRLLTLDTQLNGPLFDEPAGTVKFALGAQFRRESLDQAELLTPVSSFNPARTVYSEFVELQVPILGPDNKSSSQENRVQLSIADRDEHYSDFGGTNNPQLGLLWHATQGVKVRGTYGRSFQAPLLTDLNPVPTSAIVFPLTNTAGGSPINSLIVGGGNAALRPETAVTWTGGIDLTPARVPSLRLSATYYNIRFSNQIASAEQTVPNLLNSLEYADVLGPTIIQRNPSLALIQQLSDTPDYLNPFGIAPAAIAAIVDFRENNLSIVTTDGVDLEASEIEPTPLGELHLGIEGTYVLGFTNRFTVSAPEVSILNTIYNPVALRLRGQLGMVVENFSGMLYINYTGSYRDTYVYPPTPISSWCTADVSLTYDVGGNSHLDNTRFSLTVTNIANHDPPFVTNPTYPINYDGANANALGRVYAVEVTTRW